MDDRSPVQVRLEERPVGDHAAGQRIAFVMVDNQEQRNALSNHGKRALAEAIEGLASDDALRAIVLTGAGDTSFIGGAHIGEMAGFAPDDAAEGPRLTHRACDAIRRAPVPVIARINGWCLGAGLEIAASCDMRIAAEHAVFGMPEVLFGLPSGMEACLLPQLIGWGKTRELVFTGRRIDAQEALRCGLIERLAPPGELDAALDGWLVAILAAGPRAVRAQKALITEWERVSIAASVEAGIAAVAAAHGTEEPRRLMQAFLARKRGA
jgi:enoyl-CoA hydratase/carnithine racemase